MCSSDLPDAARRAWLDEQYSPSRRARDAGASLALGRDRTDLARASHSSPAQHGRIAYGAREAQQLEWFAPQAQDAHDQGRPMFAMLHGGWWQEGSIDDAGRYAQIVTDAGGIHLSIGYTLTPHVTLGEILDEVATAIDAIATHAEEFGGDPSRIVLGGHSAGAHLAAMLVTAGAGRVSDDVRGRITGLMLISGVYDLAPIVES